MTLRGVCFLGAYDPFYARNRVLRHGLEHQGIRVVECRVGRRLNLHARMRRLRQRFGPLAGECDVLILAEFNQMLAPFAAWLARRYRKHLIIDAFTSLYDSEVHDRGSVSPDSARAARYWLADWLALRLGQRALVDTAQHAEYFARNFGVRRDRMRVIPVGASREWFEAPAGPHQQGEMLVLFYGTYIPLHGVQTILEAACLLQSRPDIHFRLIGGGQAYESMRQYAGQMSLSRVSFADPVGYSDLPRLVAQADICLGIFGTTEKAGRVIPNKVYQSLALGKPVITADTPALREGFIPGEHLLAVPPGDAPALAEAIRSLADDEARRGRIGAAGRRRMLEAFTEEQIGRRLVEALR